METWLILTIISALMSGLAGFILKVVAKRNYNSELHIFYSAIFGIALILPLILLLSKDFPPLHLALFCLGAGFLAAITGIFKVYALRYIDTTIYFPLFKIVSPLIAIVIGIILFDETFTQTEWVGLIISLFVPLLLITKAENGRQNNLFAGLLLILFTGSLAAVITSINKYTSTDFSNGYPILFWVALFNIVGVIVGSVFVSIKKHGTSQLRAIIVKDTSIKTLQMAFARSLTINSSFVAMLFAFHFGGSLGIIYTIASMYILVPIALAIIFYQEHWDVQKALAATLSIVALGFFA
jgi:drug/metabolite transporter (DMT)-like permease